MAHHRHHHHNCLCLSFLTLLPRNSVFIIRKWARQIVFRKLHNVLLVGDVSEGGDEIPEEGIVLKTGSRGQMSHKHTLVFWLSSSLSYSSQSVLLDNNTKVIRDLGVYLSGWGQFHGLLAKWDFYCSGGAGLRQPCSAVRNFPSLRWCVRALPRCSTAAHRNKAAALPQWTSLL